MPKGSAMSEHVTIPPEGTVRIDTEVRPDRSGGRLIATQDREVIRQWAERHSAEPAVDGDAAQARTKNVQLDVRFNFPGVHRYRPASWDEWFDIFTRKALVFVYEEEVADRAYELWERRGGEHGQDQRDWFEAQRQLEAEGMRPSGDYRFVKET
jgi:hypothetical protein